MASKGLMYSCTLPLGYARLLMGAFHRHAATPVLAGGTQLVDMPVWNALHLVEAS